MRALQTLLATKLPLLCSLAILIGSAAAAPRAQAALTATASEDFELVPWVNNVANVTDVAFLPDGRAVLTLRAGEIRIRRANGTIKRDAASISVNSSHPEQGLLGVVALRSWREKSDGSEAQRTVFFYASSGQSTSDRHQVLRGVVQADDTITIDTANPIIETGLKGPANHNGGGLIVYKNQLYIGVGDTGANATPPRNKFSTCLNNTAGSILRVNLDGSTPNDNPLVGINAVTGCDSVDGNLVMRPPDTRLFAWGLRNPWRFWIDPMTDKLWIGDVGEGAKEEISIGDKGDHFGYPFEEGSRAYNQPWNNNACQGVTPASACVKPTYDYDNEGRSGSNCVIGGLIPNEDGRLCGWPEGMSNRYFFGDHGSGILWTLGVSADRLSTEGEAEVFATDISRITSFRMGFDDALYLVRHGASAISRITPKGRDAALCARMADMNTGGNSGSAGNSGGGTGGTRSTGGTSGNTPGGGPGGQTGQAGTTPGKSSGGSTGSDSSPQSADSKTKSDGCGCSVERGFSVSGLGLMALVAGLLLWRRKRRV